MVENLEDKGERRRPFLYLSLVFIFLFFILPCHNGKVVYSFVIGALETMNDLGFVWRI
jgi:hypothetical protein